VKGSPRRSLLIRHDSTFILKCSCIELEVLQGMPPHQGTRSLLGWVRLDTIGIPEVVVVVLSFDLHDGHPAVLSCNGNALGRGVAREVFKLLTLDNDHVGLRVVGNQIFTGIPRLLNQIADALAFVSSGFAEEEQVVAHMVPLDDAPNKLDE